MNALKERIIEKLHDLPEHDLQRVMDYLTFLKRESADQDSSLRSIAGILSGVPLSAQEIEKHLYRSAESR